MHKVCNRIRGRIFHLIILIIQLSLYFAQFFSHSKVKEWRMGYCRRKSIDQNEQI